MWHGSVVGRYRFYQEQRAHHEDTDPLSNMMQVALAAFYRPCHQLDFLNLVPAV